ncbi:MAG: hypothetical protein JNJ59_24030 [Deltaproteobacteria bacterium]|nr:hypothetical protein [Deltaproteobacteria bacterium]
MLSRHVAGGAHVGTWEHDGSGEVRLALRWAPASPEATEVHGDLIDATEYGAYAVAIALVDVLGFKVLGRAARGTGADWWIEPRWEGGGEDGAPWKLEVSGIDSGTGAVRTRLRAKVDQGRRGEYHRPGIAVVVRFCDVRAASECWT